jgi:hypothetical protein
MLKYREGFQFSAIKNNYKYTNNLLKILVSELRELYTIYLSIPNVIDFSILINKT